MISRTATSHSTMVSQFRRNPRLKQGLILVIGVGLLLWLSRLLFGPEHLPDFKQYTNTQEKKTAFFEYLAPRIADANAPILEQREKLLKIREQVAEDGNPGWLDTRWLKQTLAEYEFDVPEEVELSHVDDLLRRVDIIPPSLIMAQAANESAWGTSRFARQGNNFFGMRTHEIGTGIVPKKRAAGAKWEVAAYDSVSEGIGDYIYTLNTNPAYRQLRNIRRDLRRQNLPLNGQSLAGGLTRYSEKGYEYVSIIRSMIQSNDLRDYDQD